MKMIAIQISGDGLDWSRVPDPLSFDEENESSHEFQAWSRLRIAVANDADHRRVGIAEVALEAEGCSVTVSKPHPEGAAGIVRTLVENLISTTARPPGT